MNYEIIALGDANYVRAVLDAAAGITNYGTFGAVGALIGLVLMAVKGMTDPGGPKLDLAPFAVSIVLFWIMFLIRVDEVIVTEIMVQPGEVAPRAYTVDNVPFGLAAVGFGVSTVTHAFTQQYETSFGSATDSARGTTGGLGQNLMLLTQMRTLLSNPNFTDPPVGPGGKSWLATYRANMGAFLTNCTLPLVNNGVLSRDSIMSLPGITGAVNDTTAHQIRTTTWENAPGDVENTTCAKARLELEKATQDPTILQKFDEAAAAAGMKQVNAAAIQEAFGTWTNQNAQSMQTMVATLIMHSVLKEAAVRGSLSPADTQAIVMVEEAAQRRNVQATAEESLFIRILRPTVSFFEAFFYALAPIMALVVCMGRFGWSMLGKYMALPLWVGLWFPMLAITQLFSSLSMQYFFDRLGDGSTQYSPAQLQQIANQAMDTLGAAATFTAATPAIAMSILFGGAVSMSYLAGRLQGSDMIDENKVAPQASKVDAIATQNGAVDSSIRGGHTTGGSNYSYNSGDSISNATALASSASMQSNKQWNAATTNTNGEQLGFGVSGSHREGVVAGKNLADTYQNSVQSLEQRSILTTDQVNALSKAGDALQVHAGVGTPAKLVVDAGVGKQWMSATELANAQQAADAYNKAVADNKQLGTQFAVSAAKDTQDALGTDAMHGFSKQKQSQISEAAADVVSAGTAVTDTQTIQRSVGSSESVPLAAAANRFSVDQISDMRGELVRMGVSEKELDQRILDFAPTNAADPKARELGAYIDAMQTAKVDAGFEAERAELYAGTMQQVFAGGGATPTFDTGAANDVRAQGAALDQGGTRAHVEKNIQAPAQVNVEGTVGERLNAAGHAVRKGESHIDGSDTAGAANAVGMANEAGGVTRETLDDLQKKGEARLQEQHAVDRNVVKSGSDVSGLALGLSAVNSVNVSDVGKFIDEM